MSYNNQQSAVTLGFVLRLFLIFSCGAYFVFVFVSAVSVFICHTFVVRTSEIDCLKYSFFRNVNCGDGENLVMYMNASADNVLTSLPSDAV